jgi:hypothetical protein
MSTVHALTIAIVVSFAGHIVDSRLLMCGRQRRVIAVSVHVIDMRLAL